MCCQIFISAQSCRVKHCSNPYSDSDVKVNLKERLKRGLHSS